MPCADAQPHHKPWRNAVPALNRAVIVPSRKGEQLKNAQDPLSKDGGPFCYGKAANQH